MRRYDTHFPEDSPEAIVCERIEAIAYDLERIADSQVRIADALFEERLEHQAYDLGRIADALEAIADD